MTETPIAFSFLRLNNMAKGLFKPHAPDEADVDWLEKRADKKTKKDWKEYNKVLKQNGVWAAKVKSDSIAALGAATKLRSKDPRMNSMARELALDLAEGSFEVTHATHVPGVSHVIADCLSRRYGPSKEGA